MSATRVPVGRLATLAAVVVGAFALAQTARGPHWRTVAPGLEFATIRGEPWCRAGSSTIAVLRLDPARVRVRVRHYSGLPGRAPITSAAWLDHSRALAVLNAGQYYPDFSYMGLLVSDGRPVSTRLHPSFRALLVAEPERDSVAGTRPGAARAAGSRRARLVDLEHEPVDPGRPGWRQVAQSFMLFDRNGAPRVRRTDQVANRTVVAEDRAGRLLMVTSEGGYTLRDFAELLRQAPLELTHAMAMDGGHEAQLCVRAGNFRYASFGQWRAGEARPAAWDAQVPLPAVVTLEPW